MNQAIWLHSREDMVRAFAKAAQADEILRRIGRRFEELERRRAMNFDVYQQQAGRTDPHAPGTRDALGNGALGLVGEAGEVAELVKKHLFHGHPIDKAAVTKELGDVLWYVARLAAALGISLGDVAVRNLDKLQRRYPNGFSHERSRNRPENAANSAHSRRSGVGQGVGSGPDQIADSAAIQGAGLNLPSLEEREAFENAVREIAVVRGGEG